MKKIREFSPWILLIWPYLVLLALVIPEGGGHDFFLASYVVLTVVIYMLNICNAFAHRNEDEIRKLAFYDMLLKLVHIPYYIGVFAIGVIMFCAMVVPALLLISPIIIIILFVTDVFLMLTTSMYGISVVAKTGKRGMISKGGAVSLGILHCFFVTDVICSIILFCKVRKAKNQ